jgi:hypothetical protein
MLCMAQTSMLVRYRFTLTPAPDVPTLTAPANGATGVGIDTLLAWGAVSTATKYHDQLDTIRDFSGVLKLNDSTVTLTNDSTKTLANSDMYYWRVRAGNAGGWSAYSAVDSFTTVASAGGTTVYDTIKADNRDANSQGTANEWLEYDGENTHFGEDSGVWRVGFLFALNIPQGKTIDSAFVTFTTVTYNGWQAGDVLDWKVYDVDTAPVFDGSHTHSLEAHAAVSATVVSGWSMTATVGTLTSPDLKTIVQIPISRGGWTANNLIGIIMVPNSWTATHATSIGDYVGVTTNNTAKIKVTYH